MINCAVHQPDPHAGGGAKLAGIAAQRGFKLGLSAAAALGAAAHYHRKQYQVAEAAAS